ncbi:MAG: 50S ribosomal protein L11 methyltransferase [Deltaproteobacteria bacterium]|nr:50S ribosomal protein L11 methyltransferase [Deltaproteobacteria bacterium]
MKKINRLSVLVRRGYEELLSEDVYKISKGVWVENKDEKFVRLVFYPDDPEILLSAIKETVEILDYTIDEECDKNYEISFRKFFRPIKIGNVYVISPWDDRNQYERHIIIEPGIAFGTGRHETTKIMMLLMRELDFKSKDVIDLGCGSGILSIYASMLGANRVLGIDLDATACVSAKKNVGLNGTINVEIEEKNISEVKGKFDIILGNLDIGLFKTHIDHIVGLLKEEGKCIFSGILRKEREEMILLLKKLQIIKEKRLRSWIGFLVRAY